MRTRGLWLTLVATIALYAQSPSTPCQQQAVALHTVVDPQGWEIPGLKGSTISSARARFTGAAVPGIFVTQLSAPNGEVLVELPDYSVRCNQLEIRKEAFGVQRISQLDVRGRTFAYFVEANRINSIHPPITHAGSVSFFVFTDTTGSGVFDLYESYLTPPFRSELPEWVRKLAATLERSPNARNVPLSAER